MANTAKLDIPELVEGQNGAEVKVNDAIRRLESLSIIEVLDRDLTAPPGSESNGDTYIVGASATGDWASQDGKIALYYDGWIFTTPKGAMQAFVKDEKIWVGYSSAESLWHPMQKVWDTTEYWTGRYDGADKVYAKALTGITAPNGAVAVNTAHGVTGINIDKRIVLDVCYYDTAGTIPAFANIPHAVEAKVDGTNFILTGLTALDLSALTVDVLIEYTK